jgi:hypothetical protein
VTRARLGIARLEDRCTPAGLHPGLTATPPPPSVVEPVDPMDEPPPVQPGGGNGTGGTPTPPPPPAPPGDPAAAGSVQVRPGVLKAVFG